MITIDSRWFGDSVVYPDSRRIQKTGTKTTRTYSVSCLTTVLASASFYLFFCAASNATYTGSALA